MTSIYAIQWFYRDKWQTFYLTTDQDQADEGFRHEREYQESVNLDTQLRLVKISVNDLEFLGTICRNFEVLNKINY